MAGSRKDSRGRNLKIGESQRSDSRYQYQYTDNSGNRHCIYEWDLPVLREREKQIQKDLDDNINTDGAKMLLNSLFKDWIDSRRIKLATRNNYLNLWQNHVEKSTIGIMQIGKIKKSNITKFYNTLSDKGLATGTIKLIHNILYSCLDMALEDELIRKNPSRDCMKNVEKKEAKTKNALTVEEQSAFVNFISKSETYNIYLPLITFMLGTGARCGEVIGLTWKDIDLKNNIVNINHQLIYKQKDGRIQFYATTPKSDSGKRDIPLLDEVKKQLKLQREYQLILGIKRDHEIDSYKDFVFTTKGGKPFQPNCINRVLINIINTYNIQEEERAKKENRDPKRLPHISVHSLRHTFCTRFCENESNIKVIQEIMGHSDISITMSIYNHVTKDKAQEVMANLNNKIKIS